MRRIRRNPFKRGALSRSRKGGKYLKSQANFGNAWGKFRSKEKGYASSTRAHKGNTSIGQVPNREYMQDREVTTNVKIGTPDIWDFDDNILTIGRDGSKITSTSFNDPVNITKTKKQKAKKESIFSTIQSFVNKLFGGNK